MAKRPIFIPDPDGLAPVRTEYVEFAWHAGLAVTQKQKSVASLHEAARRIEGVNRLLEVSSKSTDKLGVALSAFNLRLEVDNCLHAISVECAYQGSKVFEMGGPFTDMLRMTPREAKKDARLQASGRLVGFLFQGRDWALEPRTAFYDWVYISALKRRDDFCDQLSHYSAFTDIEFNPERSINCQAYSVALFLSLKRANILSEVTQSADAYLKFVKSVGVHNARENDQLQPRLL